MMTLRSLRSCLVPAALLAVACSRQTANAPKPPSPPATGTDVVQRMYGAYSGKWFQTMQFTQENTRYAANGRTERSQWKEYMLVPGRLRIEFLPASGGNGAVYADGSVHSFEGGKLSRTVAQTNILLVLTADVYAQATAASIRQLAGVGVDLARLRRDTWNARPMWVVGATSGTDLSSPQFWVDAETWVVTRVFDRSASATPQGVRPATEFRLTDYRTLSGVPVVHEITFLRDGQPFFKEQYTDVVLNATLDARLFSSSQWRVPGRAP